MSDDMLELIAFNTIELTMAEPLTDLEARRLIEGLERYAIETVVNSQNRIVVCEVRGDEQMEDILGDMGDMGLVEDIARIRIITDLEPQWQREAELWPLQ